MKLHFKISYIILFAICFQTNSAFTQDSIKTIKRASKYFSYKVPSLILGGEIPFMIEYLSDESIGNLFSVGFIYMNFKPGAQKMFCYGYKISYGARIYKGVTQSWYFGPQIFYKHMWIDNRYYTSNFHPFNLSESQAHPDSYLYFENRQVFGVQLLFGWIIPKGLKNIEIYTGLGFRNIDSFQEITKWLTSEKYPALPSDYLNNLLPKTSKTINGFYPSIQFGCNISFSFYKKVKK